MCVLFCKQKTAYEMRISDWSSDVCSSDLAAFRWARDRTRPSARAPRATPAPTKGAGSWRIATAWSCWKTPNGDGPNGRWKWGRGAPVVRPAPISDVGASGDGDVGAVAAGVAERRRGGIAGPARVPAVVGVGDGADIGRGVEEIIERRGIERRQDRKSTRLNS